MKPSSSASIHRRTFLRLGATAGALLSVPQFAPGRALGAAGAAAASERVKVGVIGLGAMGSGHVRRLAGDPAFELIGVCDVDRSRRESAKAVADAHSTAAGGKARCEAHNDYRELLDREEVDAVVIVTPDHWHALQAVDAAKAGKDIYSEKPISMTIEEGRKVVEAVQRYGRVFQTGSQYRSIPGIRRVCEFVREGKLGKVRSVFTLLNNLGGFIGSGRFQPYANVMRAEVCGKSYVPLEFPLPAEPVPDGLDWELWVGPAAWRPFNSMYHVNPSPGVVPWSFAEGFGVTSLTWHLAHSADVIQWALGAENSGPVEVIHPNSGRFPTLTCRYASGTLLHFVDHWGMVKELYKAVPANARLAGNFGGIFVGDRGWVTSMTTGGPLEGEPDEIFQEMDLPTREVNPGMNNHHANWRECIQTRKRPSSDEEIGHRSASLGHLTNIAFWTGQSLKWDPVTERFEGNEAANRLRSRPLRGDWRL